MSTSIAILSEGPIDQVLLEPLLQAIARQRAGYTWPLRPEDGAEAIGIRKRGFGGVVAALKRFVEVLDQEPLGYEAYIIVLDRRTRPAQDEVRELIKGRANFILAVATEEIEAWWLGDRDCTLHWAGFPRGAPSATRYAARHYRAEEDDGPKKTLDELTALSPRLDSRYGVGSVELAKDFAETWNPDECLGEIRRQCPKGFDPFLRQTSMLFNRLKRQAGQLPRKR